MQSQSTLSGDQDSSVTQPVLYSILASLQDGAAAQESVPLYSSLNKKTINDVTVFLMHAASQAGFDFVEGLQHMAESMGLEKNAETWWVGGDLTGKFSEETSRLAVRVLQAFIETHFLDDKTQEMRKDRLLISEYAGPLEGNRCSAIRCVGKLLEETPALTNNYLAYGVQTSMNWFQSIGAVPHQGVQHFYAVHGKISADSQDDWASTLGKNVFILEGGARSLDIIFSTIARGGKVIGVHGFRDKTPDYFDQETQKFYMSAAKFVTALCEKIKGGELFTNRMVMAFWKEYSEQHPPFNPHASDAHTKQAFIDAAWKVFFENDLLIKITDQFKGQHFLEYLRVHQSKMFRRALPLPILFPPQKNKGDQLSELQSALEATMAEIKALPESAPRELRDKLEFHRARLGNKFLSLNGGQREVLAPRSGK